MFIIAEIGINHGGDRLLAKEMISAAKEAGADAVKFQAFTAADFDDKHLAAKLQPYQLRPYDFANLAEEAVRLEIPFFASVFSGFWADYLFQFVPLYKIASRSAADLPFLQYVAAKGKPLLISFGMGNLGNAAIAQETALLAGAPLVVMMHCISKYPTPAAQADLGRLTRMKAVGFDPIGYSDHTVGNYACFAAAGLGATVFEKHFCIDRERIQNDDIAGSCTPVEFRDLVAGLRAIEAGLIPARGEPQQPITAGIEPGSLDAFDVKLPAELQRQLEKR